MKVGLIGNGAIAGLLTEFCAVRPDVFEIVGALVRRGETASRAPYLLADSLQELLAAGPDLVVEVAGHEAVAAYASAIVRTGVDLILASTGSLAEEALLDSIKEASIRSSSRVRLPAGALAGIDALSAARLGGLTEVRLQSSKPPIAWSGTAAERVCRLDAIQAPQVIFEGNAREAAIAFPKNANVAATTALAGLGFERTKVRLMANPASNQNIHRLEARGRFGDMALEVRAHPAPGNPKTSYLAALSIMRLLENEAAGIVV